MERSGDTLKLKCFDAPTSVENLAHQLFSEISAMGFRLERLEVQETDTSTIVYARRNRSSRVRIRASRWFSMIVVVVGASRRTACIPPPARHRWAWGSYLSTSCSG